MSRLANAHRPPPTARRSLTARAPTRIDFGGGWTDVPPYPADLGGFVCNVAIDRYARVTLRDGTAGGDGGRLPLVRAALERSGLPSLAVELQCDFPTGAGLGGSSAALVALTGALAAWKRDHLSRDALAMRSRATEVEDLGIAGGWQDHYAAAFGGALALHHDAHGTRVERIPLGAPLARELARRCLVVYTGESRISARAIELVLQGYARREPVVTSSLAAMKDVAQKMAAVLRAGGADAIDELGRLLRTHWEHQRRLHAEITTPRIDLLSTRAYSAGALGVKALGASGGGCLAIIAPTDGVERVREALGGDAEILRWAVDDEGFTVVEERDE